MSLPSINTCSKKISRMASKCHLIPVCVISQSKETLTRIYTAEYGVRAICENASICYWLSFVPIITQKSLNNKQVRWGGLEVVGIMIMIYNDNFTDSSGVCKIAALLLLWTVDVQASLLCFTHLKADGCSLALHRLWAGRDKKNTLKNQAFKRWTSTAALITLSNLIQSIE